MVEIIATVAILGVISTIAIFSVTNIIERGKQEHYESAEKTIKMSAESYAQANRKYLPKNVGEKKKIYLNQLIEDNYVEKVYDYYDKECYADQSYVQIFKYSKTDYSYMTYLKCPDYSNEEDINEGIPEIKIDMTEPTEKNVKKTDAKITITDDKKLLSYSITIYKNGKEIYTTGNVEANYETNIRKNYDISKYTPGTIKVVVKAINIYGLEDTKTKEKTYADTYAPECIISEEDTTRTNDDWINGDRTITVGCNDGEEGSGCARDTFTKTFTKDAKDGYIEIKDKAGNKRQCKVDVYIDKTAPNPCSIAHSATKGLSNWYIQDARVSLTSSDAMSGIKYKSLTTSSTAPTNSSGYNGLEIATQSDTKGIKWYGYVEDYAGNKSDCVSSQFKVDTTAPTQPSGGSITISGSTAQTTLGAVSNSTDATSGVKEYRYYVIKNDENYPENTNENFTTSGITFTRECGKTYYAYAIAVDNAGNKSSVYRIGTGSDGANAYSEWGVCSKKCGGGTQTRTNSCALVTTGFSQDCETQECCSRVTYKDGTTCSAPCGDGTYNQLAYSYYDGTRCSGSDLDSGGAYCFLKSCCTESTTYGEYGSCTCSAGGSCTKTRTKTVVTCSNGVASTTTTSDPTSCSYPSHTHDFHARGKTKKSLSFSWDCTGGHTGHTTGYYIYCKYCGARPKSGATLVCPTNPYYEQHGWTLLDD